MHDKADTKDGFDGHKIERVGQKGARGCSVCVYGKVQPLWTIRALLNCFFSWQRRKHGNLCPSRSFDSLEKDGIEDDDKEP